MYIVELSSNHSLVSPSLCTALEGIELQQKISSRIKPNPDLWLNTFMYAEPTSCASFVGNFNIEEIQNQYLCTLPFPDITTEIPYPRNRTWQENDGWGNKWSMVWHCTFTFYQFFIRPRRRKNSCNKYSKLQKSLKAVENWSLNNHFLAETSQ